MSSTPRARPASPGAWSSATAGWSITTSRPRRCSTSRPRTGSCSSRRSASTSPSRSCSRPGSAAPPWCSATSRPCSARRNSRAGSAASGSPSSTCRRSTGTPGSRASPASASGSPSRCAWWSSAARRRRPAGSPTGAPRRRPGPMDQHLRADRGHRGRDGLRAAGAGAAPPELPIGRPIADTRVYLLDRDMELVPLGLPGELYIGGEGVARGYLHRPGPTAERFVPDPSAAGRAPASSGPATAAAWRPDGQLEFLGRVDHQVKVRGFRVEPGEVEAVLRRHPGGAARPWSWPGEDAAGNRRLAAYVVPRRTAGPEPAELRRWLQSALPEYMIPSAFVHAGGPAALAQRQDRPQGAAGPRPGTARPGRRVRGAPRLRSRRRSPGSGPRCSSSSGSACTTTSSTSAATRSSRSSSSRGSPRPWAGRSRSRRSSRRRRSPRWRRSWSATRSDRPIAGPMATIPPRWPAGCSRPSRPRMPRAREHRAAPVPVALRLRRARAGRCGRGELFPVIVAAISSGLDRTTVIHDWCGNRPVIADVRETPLGRIGTVMIPRFNDQLYLDRGRPPGRPRRRRPAGARRSARRRSR